MLCSFATVETMWDQGDGDVEVMMGMENIGGNKDSCEGGHYTGSMVWVRNKTVPLEMTHFQCIEQEGTEPELSTMDCGEKISHLCSFVHLTNNCSTPTTMR